MRGKVRQKLMDAIGGWEPMPTFDGVWLRTATRLPFGIWFATNSKGALEINFRASILFTI
ncbi:hypothetical protein E0765_07090 [Sulfuricurvum sp. IAE1]|uniref:hypothetical protein n=1 Tax=Sulfuricurvum sp. IAE1 TaxID=2546102 RepID=UPI0010481609|nr:hypothetical protein [Sulfuricurvum sp. IAE1]TDA63593.1 hypothetical protein E0765_07090 [Sulfuricurvum sp. IAE1]